MRVDFKSGNWVEMRGPDELNAGDRLAVRGVIQMPVNGRLDTVPNSYKDEERLALLARIITSWSYPGWPIPSLCNDPAEMVRQIPLRDYDELTLEIAPHMEVADYYPSRETSGESSSTSTE